MRFNLTNKHIRKIWFVFVAICIAYGFFFYFSQQNLLSSITKAKLEYLSKYSQQKEKDENELMIERVSAIASTVAKLCATQMENTQTFVLQKDGIEATLSPFLDYPEIAGIEVKDKENKPYAVIWKSDSRQIVFRTNYVFPPAFREKFTRVVKSSVISNNESQGTINIYVDDSSIANAITSIKLELNAAANAELKKLRESFRAVLIPQMAVLVGVIILISIFASVLRRSYLLIKNQHRELAAFNHTLEQRVEERTLQLEEQVSKVSQLNEEITTESVERAKLEKKYRDIFEYSTEGIFQATPTGEIISANIAFAKILGYENSDELKENISNLVSDLYMPPSQLERAKYILAEEGAISQFEFGIQKKNGEEAWLSISARIVRDDHSNIAMYEGTISDVTRRKRIESALLKTQEDLVTAARQAGMAEIATNVLHNVGNILNSVNVSTQVVASALRNSKVAGFIKATKLIQENLDNLGEYLATDPKGKMLPNYLVSLAETLVVEQKENLSELHNLGRSLDHMKDVVSMQQSYASNAKLEQPAKIQDLIQDAIRMSSSSLARHQVHTVVEVDHDLPVLLLDKSRILQILVNLIKNGKQAMDHIDAELRQLTISCDLQEKNAEKVLMIRVRDTGEGITAENLNKIFTHGFTTRKEGHGFGLHSCANAAAEMGGALIAESDGAGLGASFILTLPVSCKVDSERTQPATEKYY